MREIISDDVLVAYLKAGGTKRQEAIAYIYQDKGLKNQVIALVSNSGGNREDGIDIFHEGIIALDDNIRKDKYQAKGSLKAYLFSICRFLWLNKSKRDKRLVLTAENTPFELALPDTPESLFLTGEQEQILNQLLSRLGAKCEQILMLWKLSYSMEEIAQQVGLGNAGIARRQKYTCYEKLLQIVDQEPNLKNILK